MASLLGCLEAEQRDAIAFLRDEARGESSALIIVQSKPTTAQLRLENAACGAGSCVDSDARRARAFIDTAGSEVSAAGRIEFAPSAAVVALFRLPTQL